MVLTDPKKLAKLMLIQGVSHRELAAAAGWKSHSYVGRLLRGEARTLDPVPAVRIAAYLHVGVDDLFLPRSSRNSGHASQRTRKSAA